MTGVPSSVFKYMASKHAAALVSSGSVRIGTLAEFRNVEAHGTEVGDPEEGRDLPTEVVASASSDNPDSISPFVRQFVGPLDGPGHLTIRGTTFQQVVEIPHCYAFCSSLSCDRTQMLDLGYDTCVEIRAFEHFISALTTRLNQKHLIRGAPLIGPCVYSERERAPTEARREHPGLLKPVRYAYQREVRALWAAALPDAAPEVLEVRAAARFCRIVDLGGSAA